MSRRSAWGNLLQKSVTKCSAENISLIAAANNQLSGYGYDAAGNMTSDPTDGVAATYDAENRISTATRNGATTTYGYDADGNRVEKSNGTSPSGGTLYWYMTPGIVAESDLAGNLQSEYVFFDGERVARKDFPSNAVSYYFSDHLKTTDIITDAAGNIKSESDYYPWGGELPFIANDSNHYKFTGKERDTETQLDYLGARYYSNGLGRLVSADWSAIPIPVPYANFGNPQSLNLYSYSVNNPTTFADLDGHYAISGSGGCSNGLKLEPLCQQQQGNQGNNDSENAKQEPPAEVKVAVNTLIDIHNLGSDIACASNRHCHHAKHLGLLKPSNDEEAKYMEALGFSVLFLDFEEMFPVKGAKEFEYVTHHGLPQQKKLRAIFEALELDIEKYTIRMENNRHRFIHTNKGGNWNRVWEKFLRDPKNHDVGKVLNQLNKMIRDFRLHEPL